MKIAFFWTWEFSKNILSWILNYSPPARGELEGGIKVLVVVSQPDKTIWRNKTLTKTKIKEFSEDNNIEILQPETLKNNKELIEKLKWLDFIVVVAYWKIIPKEILDLPKYWCINIHWSILPKYRWASPIQEAIKNWDKKTWLTIMFMSEKMDEWDILNIKEIDINEFDTTKDIFKKFEEIWPSLLINTLNWIIKWNIKQIKQEQLKSTYCQKITKNDWEIFFSKQKANEIFNKYRAYNSWPWIFTYYNWKKLNIEECCFSNIWDFEKNYSQELIPWKILKIDKKNFWVVCFDKKIIILKQIKLEWKKTMDINSFINWNQNFLNYKF